MFATKAAALQRARQLKCAGAFAMGQQWMPCKDLEAYEKAVRREMKGIRLAMQGRGE
jgi:hypothetical protein